MATIGEQIRSARKKKGMTQDELASALNITRTGISKWETDDRIPDAEMLLRLTEVLDYQFTRNTAENEPEEPEENTVPKPEAEKPAAPAAPPAAPEETAPAFEKEVRAAPDPSRLRRMILAGAAAFAVIILAVVLILLNQPKNENPPAEQEQKRAAVFTDGMGKEYTTEEFRTVTPADASKAYLSFQTALRFTGEGTEKHIFFDFNMQEDHGIALHIDRIDMILFYTNGSASADTFTAKDLTDWGDNPDIPAYGTYIFSGGTDYYNSKGEVDSAGVALKVYCTDAGDNPLIFTSFISFPAE